ncbi:hypothetical protein IMF23_13590 [Chelatococcus daeguensis]|uniref:hypothetical protein n=1 Tax=Chelatococcus daeguensis TaxID=444444 RepID=UPI000A45AFB8|nr:hypothetical protein [Chelatococcus daeguensis]MBM3084472.1 hypothetical protein [Chelatococcus daeguensis]
MAASSSSGGRRPPAARPEEVVAMRFATLPAAELIALDEASGAEATMMLFP